MRRTHVSDASSPNKLGGKSKIVKDKRVANTSVDAFGLDTPKVKQKERKNNYARFVCQKETAKIRRLIILSVTRSMIEGDGERNKRKKREIAEDNTTEQEENRCIHEHKRIQLQINTYIFTYLFLYQTYPRKVID
ncbi:hypothetical protein, unlikely [Trypanosoma brucei gambiense DAL972]|uniref:Uncharacterized protein n=1 Tax=Trypanosoma brucei gambiense (strain MHOM/CI/86/DAL972) TaxID=679716 RepID=C9ZL53_TRYB9|nr:hypothetical protein, unlikely [Trypanosoma brucei gambiense DAL972]CBH10062.1 hypothetical protein, unlikely [Trypanosoma brucei gambiense DAL972]|eukprot:XP_011772352.1 hypothetical protein, unlikely [Trypanosoma brucei gambiense DAL972]